MRSFLYLTDLYTVFGHTDSWLHPYSRSFVCIYWMINTVPCKQQCSSLSQYPLDYSPLHLTYQLILLKEQQLNWIIGLISGAQLVANDHLRKTNLYVLSPFGAIVGKSTGNVSVVHLSSSSSSSSVNALNRPGIPSKSSTCDWRDTFRVSVGFGHISEEKKNRIVDAIYEFSCGSEEFNTHLSNCSIQIANGPNTWSTHGNMNSFYCHIYSSALAYISIQSKHTLVHCMNMIVVLRRSVVLRWMP